MRASVVIVEDEEPAREAMIRFATADRRLNLVGVARDGPEALNCIDVLKPQLVLIDIAIPGFSGLDVLARTEVSPHIIFTTADAGHAVSAFDLGAVDYLLKPFGETRFRAAIDRFENRRTSRTNVTPSARTERLFVRHGNRTIPVAVREIARVEASGDYALLHAPGGPFWHSTSLAALAEELDPNRFVRVHRSHLVNWDHVASLDLYKGRRLLVRLKDGAGVVASRAFSRKLRSMTG